MAIINLHHRKLFAQNVQTRLQLANRTHWATIRPAIDFPNQPWDTTADRGKRLDSTVNDAVNASARQQVDFGAVTRCLQRADEPLPDFIACFSEVWNSLTGIHHRK
ncbi:hypothetical protein chiPu_0021660 [Chiloscyllium punctatum]|uniref:Uncharacterized protein n=1 Tax=Chiloscyllium punctatum TaxID=137246 RepID=A0A401RJP9_CHIPU|nr:hypothetical protein [Chiloscyllium punctatum]